MIENYFLIFIFIIASVLLSAIILFASYFLSNHQATDSEKLSAYECGFDPFEEARQKFDVRFYLVAILFLIFDLEISFLFPWALCLETFSFFALEAMFVFLFILTLGFIYEWKKGALEWELFFYLLINELF